MAKIIMHNVKIEATNGGSIKNYESVELNDVEMKFSENAIDFITDEKVAIFRETVKSMNGAEILELAKALQGQSEEIQKDILKKSKFSTMLEYAKELKPLVTWVIEFAKNVNE